MGVAHTHVLICTNTRIYTHHGHTCIIHTSYSIYKYYPLIACAVIQGMFSIANYKKHSKYTYWKVRSTLTDSIFFFFNYTLSLCTCTLVCTHGPVCTSAGLHVKKSQDTIWVSLLVSTSYLAVILSETPVSSLLWILGIQLKVSRSHRRWFMWWAVSLDVCPFIHFLILPVCSLYDNHWELPRPVRKRNQRWKAAQRLSFMDTQVAWKKINTESGDIAQFTECLLPVHNALPSSHRVA